MASELLHIRPATPADLTTLLAFEQALIAYERPMAPNLKTEHFHYYDLATYVDDPNVCLLVAEFEGVLVGSGYALIRVSPTYKTPDKFVYLGFMYVVPDYRGKGIIQKIIAHLIQWGEEKGLSEFQLDVYAQNESAVKAYQKIGFSEDLLKMRRNISKK